MKHALLFLIMVALIISFAPAQDNFKAGTMALTGEFHGLAKVGVGGGFGLELYPLNRLSAQAVISGNGTSLNGTSTTNIMLSTSLVYDLFTTNTTAMFIGPTLGYSHGSGDSYTWGAKAGGQLCGVFDPNLSISYSIPFTITNNTATGAKEWSFGQIPGELQFHLRILQPK